MAAIAWTRIGDGDDVHGRRRCTFWTMTLSTTAYAAGGYAVTGATFGIKSILGMIQIGTNPPSTTTSYSWQYNTSTGSVQAFGSNTTAGSALTEASNGNLTLTVLFLIYSISD